MKAFYSERNKAAQAATQWEDQMALEKEQMESQSELAWAKFNWEKEWGPEKFYAGLDFQQSSFDTEMDFRKSSWESEMDEAKKQNELAASKINEIDFSRIGDRDEDDYSVATVYGSDYFNPGGEGYDYTSSYDDTTYAGIDYYNQSGLNQGTWSDFMEGY